MRIFITGGTGFIGSLLTEKLAGQGHDIVMLIRDQVKAKRFIRKNISIISGDLFDDKSLREGMKECDLVYHMAAFAKPWSSDPLLPYRTNVTGTKNVLDAALDCGIKKVIITSTGGTISYSRDGNPVNETTNINPEYNTEYERTKAEAERLAIEYSGRGIHIVIVNPTRVYGPGLLSESNGLTVLIKKYVSGRWRILPGDGSAIGNYVFIGDVVEGHILAAKNGRNGERYILGGENLSFRELFKIIGEESGTIRRLIPMPPSLMKFVARIATTISGIMGVPPLITREWIDKYLNNWVVSSEKAIIELDYKITPFRTGVSKTIEWLKTTQNNDK
jgi:nucleoside-diphosphate-sugar epimerase